MNIIGISEGFHDAALTVLVDSKIIFASHSERYSRIKGDKWIHPDMWPKTQRYQPDVVASVSYTHLTLPTTVSV